MSTEDNQAIVRRWVEEALNKGSLAMADEIYTANYILHDPASPVHGPDGIKQFITMFRTGFPDLHYTLEDMIAEGDKVVALYGSWYTQGRAHGDPPDRQVCHSDGNRDLPLRWRQN